MAFLPLQKRIVQPRRSGETSDPAVRHWLALCWGMVAMMILIGGYTRLSGSGLSMVEWQPFQLLPPMDPAQWEEIFALYRRTPEYRLHHPGMNLEEFRGIFWPEYIHRLWGRLIGVVFLLPLIWFRLRGRIGRRDGRKLAGIFLLGAIQALLGWYMVKSGLSGRGEVSHYRLAAHLGLALVIYALLLSRWRALCPRGEWHGRDPRIAGWRRLTAAAIFITMLSGAMVSGLDAGTIHTTFPLMSSYIVPPDIGALSPWYRNLVDNPSAVQWLHRLLAMITITIAVAGSVAILRRCPLRPARKGACFLLTAALVQGGIGIATLIHGAPLGLAILHQAGGVLLFSVALIHLSPPGTRRARKPAARRTRGRGSHR